MEIVHPSSIDEALAGLGDGAIPLAGGTDVMVEVNFGHMRPESVVGLRRLEALKERHEKGLLTSVEFLKELLNLARDVVSAERAAPPIEREEQGKAALTRLLEEARNPETPIIVERVVNDIDGIVRVVRFDGWQSTHAGEREVKLALRKTLFKYRLHQDQELFDRAYGYIREYY